MSGELEALLKLVSDGKLTAEEAAPIVAALEREAATASESKSTASASADRRGDASEEWQREEHPLEKSQTPKEEVKNEKPSR